MRIIKTLTVTYDENEDRLHLAVRCADGHEQGLWLTQRLANLLVKVLVDRLAAAMRDTPVRATVKAAPAAGASSARGAKAAMSTRQPGPGAARGAGVEPVEVPRTALHGLVHTINVVRHAGGGHHLVLRWGTDHAMALPLDGEALRRVLQVLRLRYRTAEWPAGAVWPDWIEGLETTAPASAVVLH